MPCSEPVTMANFTDFVVKLLVKVPQVNLERLSEDTLREWETDEEGGQVSDREQPELSERPHVCPRTEQQEDQVTQRTEQKINQVTNRTEHQRAQVKLCTDHQGAHVTPRTDPQFDQFISRTDHQRVKVTPRTEHYMAQATLRTAHQVANVPPRTEQQEDKVTQRPETEGVQVTQGTKCKVAQVSPRTEQQLTPVTKRIEHHVAQVIQRTKHQEAQAAQTTEHDSQVTPRTEHQEAQAAQTTEHDSQVTPRTEHQEAQVPHGTEQCVREQPEADLTKPKEPSGDAKCSSQSATEGKAKLLSRIFKSHTPQKPAAISIKCQGEVQKESEMRKKLEDVVDEIELQSLSENVKENTSKQMEGKPNTVLIHHHLLPVPAEITVPADTKNANKLLIKKKKLLKCCYCRKRFIYANRMRLHKKQKHPFKALLAMNKTPEHMLRNDSDISSNISSYKFNEKTAALCDPLTDHSDDNLNDLDNHDDVDTDPYEGMEIKSFEHKLHKREGEKFKDKTEAKEKLDKDEEEVAKMQKSRALSILNYRAKRERMRKGKQGTNILAKKTKVKRKKLRQELSKLSTLRVTLKAQEHSATNKPPLPMIDTVSQNADESDEDLLIVDEDVKYYDEKTEAFVQPNRTSHGLSNIKDICLSPSSLESGSLPPPSVQPSPPPPSATASVISSLRVQQPPESIQGESLPHSLSLMTMSQGPLPPPAYMHLSYSCPPILSTTLFTQPTTADTRMKSPPSLEISAPQTSVDSHPSPVPPGPQDFAPHALPAPSAFVDPKPEDPEPVAVCLVSPKTPAAEEEDEVEVLHPLQYMSGNLRAKLDQSCLPLPEEERVRQPEMVRKAEDAAVTMGHRKRMEAVVAKDIEHLKNTKIQFMEELLEIKYKKEEARVELDSLKQQIQEERTRLESLKLYQISPASPPSPLQHSASAPPEDTTPWLPAAFRSNLSTFLPTGDKRTYQQMVGVLGQHQHVRGPMVPLQTQLSAPATLHTVSSAQSTFPRPAVPRHTAARILQPAVHVHSAGGAVARPVAMASNSETYIPTPVVGLEKARPRSADSSGGLHHNNTATDLRQVRISRTPTGLGSHQSQGLSSHQSQGLPSHQSRGLSPHQSQSLQSHQSQSRPSHQSQGLPSHQNQGLPSHLSQGLTSNKSQGLSPHQSQSLPSHQSQGLPTHQSQGMPSHQSQTQKNVQFAVNNFLGKAGQTGLGGHPASTSGLAPQQYFSQGAKLVPEYTGVLREYPGPTQASQGAVKPNTKPGGILAKTRTAMCEVCAKPANFLCSGCELVYYCTTDCQKASWVNHYKLCVATKAAAAAKLLGK